ncbi:30S ribosome-binding factor RbfA [Mycoplasmoides alvi]|uniref:30S ribosome-binding factor RbfA n=1 Tax=Mycoplasmoides alvi TaxID=78580 RepID=UPI00051BD3EB|nr:30S ribosome-binding factor RbfA [Mycoplasmoides alvi]
MSHHKKERLENQIAAIISKTILTTIENENVKQGVVTYVKLSPDLGVAKIFLDCLDRTKINIIKSAFVRASGVFKTALSQNLQIRKVPHLVFEVDKSIDEAIKIDRILSEIKNKDDK